MNVCRLKDSGEYVSGCQCIQDGSYEIFTYLGGASRTVGHALFHASGFCRFILRNTISQQVIGVHSVEYGGMGERKSTVFAMEVCHCLGRWRL